MPVRVVFRIPRFMELRRAPGVVADLQRRAQAIADACGGESEGYYARVSQGKTRARAAVITGTGRAIRDNAANATILRNLDRGRR